MEFNNSWNHYDHMHMHPSPCHYVCTVSGHYNELQLEVCDTLDARW